MSTSTPRFVQPLGPRRLPTVPVSVVSGTPPVPPHSPAMRQPQPDKVPPAMRCSHSGLIISVPERLRYSSKGVISHENGPHTSTALTKRMPKHVPVRDARSGAAMPPLNGIRAPRRSRLGSIAADRFPEEIGAARPCLRIVAEPIVRCIPLGRSKGRVTKEGRRGRRHWGAWRRATFCRAFRPAAYRSLLCTAQKAGPPPAF